MEKKQNIVESAQRLFPEQGFDSPPTLQVSLSPLLRADGSDAPHDMRLIAGTCGIFYVDGSKALSGGTGHPIRVCRHSDLPVWDQRMWRGWLE